LEVFMAEIEIGPLSDRLADDEMAELRKGLEKLGAPKLPIEDDGAAAVIAAGLDDDVLAEFLDRLEAYDMACEIYLPTEFEGRVEVGDLRVGSTPVLIEVLEELKDELATEADEDEENADEEDDYEDMEVFEEQLRELWKVVYNGARQAMERRVPLYVRGD